MFGIRKGVFSSDLQRADLKLNGPSNTKRHLLLLYIWNPLKLENPKSLFQTYRQRLQYPSKSVITNDLTTLTQVVV